MSRLLQRYTSSERINHWTVAISFVLAALSGLAFFHPAFNFLTVLFGGGPWTRILHPFIGVVMFLAFLSMLVRFWHHNIIEPRDRQWLSQWRDAMGNHEERLPPVGRYNGGQKLLFWVMVLCMLALLASGVMFWRPWFAGSFPIGLVRAASLVHAVSAVVLILGIIVHVYAAFWVKGTMHGMLQGTVTEKWASKHHALWYREVSGK